MQTILTNKTFFFSLHVDFIPTQMQFSSIKQMSSLLFLFCVFFFSFRFMPEQIWHVFYCTSYCLFNYYPVARMGAFAHLSSEIECQMVFASTKEERKKSWQPPKDHWPDCFLCCLYRQKRSAYCEQICTLNVSKITDQI